MKLPKTFIPSKSLDKNIEEMLKDKKVSKHREIEDIFFLLNMPEDIGDYHTYCKKIEDKKISIYAWCEHFKLDLLCPYLNEVWRTIYFKKSTVTFRDVVIYSLNFSSSSELDELIKKADVRQRYIKHDEGLLLQYLKKDNYMIAILIDKWRENDLKLFKDWYVDNFGMVKI